MPNMTLAIPEELHQRMKKHAELRWSEIARRAIEERVTDTERMNELTSKSKLTQKDVDEISLKIKQGIAKRHRL